MSYTAGRMPMISLLAGLGKEVPPFGGLSQRLQSEPAVSGHASQAPEEQLPGVEQPPASSPFLQPQL